MNKVEMVEAIIAKVNELDAQIEAMQKNLELSENTVRTQTNLKKHEMRNLMLMALFLKDGKLEGDYEKWFISATTLTSERKGRTTVILHEGDSAFDIMEQYPNLTGAKLKDIAAKQGFTIVKGVVTKM